MEPTLLMLIRIDDDSAKPVVAAWKSILGYCQSQAAHNACRAVGLETALNMILTGTPMPAKKLARAGLYDRLTE